MSTAMSNDLSAPPNASASDPTPANRDSHTASVSGPRASPRATPAPAEATGCAPASSSPARAARRNGNGNDKNGSPPECRARNGRKKAPGSGTDEAQASPGRERRAAAGSASDAKTNGALEKAAADADEEEEEEEELEAGAQQHIDDEIHAPDGGYGWVVVAAAFVNNLLLDGFCYAFGVLLAHFESTFQLPVALVALSGSLLNGCYMLSGPIASALVNAFGLRIVTITGGVIACVGLVVSTFTPPNFWLFILTFGVLTGCGIGLIYLPSLIAVSLYFDKRRALATALAVCGSGVGCIAFPPLMGLLLSPKSPFNTWDSALWIVAGLLLHCCIMGALFRPPPQYVLVEESDDEESDEEEGEEEEEREEQTQTAPAALSASKGRPPEQSAASDAAPTPIAPLISVTLHGETEADAGLSNGEAKRQRQAANGQTTSAQVHRDASTHSSGHAVAFADSKGPGAGQQRAPGSRKRNPSYSRERLDSSNLPIHSAFELRRTPSSHRKAIRSSRTPSTSTSDSHPVVYSVMDMRQASHVQRSSGRLAPGSQHSIHRQRGSSAASHVGESAPIPLNPMNRVDIFYQGSTANLTRDPSIRAIVSHHRHTSTHGDDVSLVASRYLLHQSSVIASARNLAGSSHVSTRSLKSKTPKHSAAADAAAPAVSSNKSQTQTETETDAAIARITSAEDAQAGGRALRTGPPRRLQAVNSFETDDGEEDEEVVEDEEKEATGLKERMLSVLPPSMRDVVREMSDYSLLRNPAFLMLFVANFFGILGYAIPFGYVIKYATENCGVPPERTPLLISVLGVTNTLGRLVVGQLADLRCVHSLLLHNVCLVLAGVCILALPLCTVEATLFLDVALFGVLIAPYICLTTIIICEVVGIGALTNAFGLLILSRGVATVAALPVGGLVGQLAGNNYSATFLLGGGVLVLAALLHCALHLPQLYCHFVAPKFPPGAPIFCRAKTAAPPKDSATPADTNKSANSKAPEPEQVQLLDGQRAAFSKA